MSEGYRLPAEPDAGGEYYRVCVSVPRRWEYLVAFFGALEYFEKWIAWERDEAHTGQIAAMVWKTANEITHNEWAQGECNDVEPLVWHRLKPGFWWITQETHDGGLTFNDILIGCCGPTSGPGSMPPTDDSAGDFAAAILRNYYMYLIEMMRQCIIASCGRAGFEAQVTAVLGNAASPTVVAKLGDAFDIASGLDPDDMEAMGTTECTWQEQYRCMKQKLEGTNAATWLNTLSDALTCVLNGMSDDLNGALNDAATLMGTSSFADFALDPHGGSGGGGAGFGEQGGCDIIVLDLGTKEHNLSATDPMVCEQFPFDIPDGYRFGAIIHDYKTNIDNGGNGYSPGLYCHTEPDCQPDYGNYSLWGATSYAFPLNHTRHRSIYAGAPPTLCDDAGFPATDADDDGFAWYANVDGPITTAAPIQWRNGGGMKAKIHQYAILYKP